MALEESSAIFVVGHHRALAGGTSTFKLGEDNHSLVHHQALAGGTSTFKLPDDSTDSFGAVCSCEIEVPPAEAGGV